MYTISNKMKDMEGSAIRAVLKMTQAKDLITFAAGVPDPDTLPADFISAEIQKVLKENPKLALQYGVTDGYAPLVDALTEKMKAMGMDFSQNSLMITSGGQQVADLTARCLINEDDVVAVESPTFIGCLNALRSYKANCIGLPLENDGLKISELENLCKEKKVKLLYTIPTFHNPMGVTMSLEKRKKVLELAEKYDFMILEDNPYGELRFSGEDVPTLKSMDKNGRVIYAGSLSKVIAPGLRVGWAVAPTPVLEKMVVAKQVVDVHTTMLSQIVAHKFITDTDYPNHIERCRALYGKKCQLMLDCIKEYFPPEVSYTTPNGGIFLWCDMNNGLNSVDVMKKVMEKGAVFIPGYTFMTDTSKPTSTFRLNYSIPSEDEIRTGIKIIGDVLKSLK